MYDKKEDIILLRKLLPDNEKNESLEDLSKKYFLFNTIYGKELPFDFPNQTRKLNKVAKKKMIQLTNHIYKVFYNKGIYPIYISLVAHSKRVLINPDKIHT